MELDASKYIDSFIEYGPKVLGVLLALFFAWVIASWTERGIRAGLERRNFDATLTRFFAKLGRYLIAGSISTLAQSTRLTSTPPARPSKKQRRASRA